MAWRDAGRVARIAGLDARAAIGMAPLLLHMTSTMFWVSMATTAVFVVGQFMGIGPVELFRKFRFWSGGQVRPLPFRSATRRARVNMKLMDQWKHRFE